MPFVVFEGIDRSGKSSQARRLFEYLQQQGKDAVLLRYPDRSSKHTGGIINDYLLGRIEMSLSAASLLLAANLWEMKGQLEAYLADGKYVVMDRYIWSNVAYSTARGMNSKIFDVLSQGLPVPDKLIYMKIDPIVAACRGGYGGERFEKLEFQQTVSTQMDRLSSSAESVVVIDADRGQDCIFNDILSQINI